jgi:hypothetical protein
MSVSAGCQLKRIKDGPHVRFTYRERATDEKKYNIEGSGSQTLGDGTHLSL